MCPGWVRWFCWVLLGLGLLFAGLQNPAIGLCLHSGVACKVWSGLVGFAGFCWVLLGLGFCWVLPGCIEQSPAYCRFVLRPSLTLFKVNILAKSKSIFWPRSFSHYKNRGFRRFFFAQLSLCVCVCFFLFPIIWQFSKNSLFQKKGAKIGFFNFLCFKFKF